MTCVNQSKHILLHINIQIQIYPTNTCMELYINLVFGFRSSQQYTSSQLLWHISQIRDDNNVSHREQCSLSCALFITLYLQSELLNMDNNTKQIHYIGINDGVRTCQFDWVMGINTCFGHIKDFNLNTRFCRSVTMRCRLHKLF